MITTPGNLVMASYGFMTTSANQSCTAAAAGSSNMPPQADLPLTAGLKGGHLLPGEVLGLDSRGTDVAAADGHTIRDHIDLPRWDPGSLRP